MRVAALALGTRGDLEVILRLGRELRRRGHDVAVAASPFFADAVRRTGCRWLPAGDGGRERMVAVLRAMHGGVPWHDRSRLFLDGWCGPQLAHAAAHGQLRALVDGADYFVSNLKLVLDRDGRAAEPDGPLLPGAVITYDPPVSLAELASNPPLPGQRDVILDLVALCQPLFDPAGAWSTWGKRYRFTGFWTDPASDGAPWRAPEALRAFLAAGPPPVAITAGSMVGFDTRAFVETIIEGLRLAGLRGVLLPGWSDVDGSPAPDRLHVAGEVPYGWLFARAACVVHHGSHGATAAALLAGKASIVMPHVTCQETMGKSLLWAGVGTAILDAATLVPEDLASALRRAIDDSAVAEALGRWQATVAADPGVAGAAELIERHLGRGCTD